VDPQILIREEVLQFFSSLKEHNIHDTYLSTHPIFRNKTTLAQFAWMNRVYHLDQHQGFSIQKIRQLKKLGEAEGHLELKDGSQLPISLRLIPLKTEEEWKIIHIAIDLKEFAEGQGMTEPDQEKMIAVARATIQRFQNSIRQYRMDTFYDAASRIWRQSITLESMNELYSPMMRGPYLSEDFADGSMVLSASSGVRDNGLLYLRGKVVSNMIIIFDSEYFFENGRWNLIRFEIGIE